VDEAPDQHSAPLEPVPPPGPPPGPPTWLTTGWAAAVRGAIVAALAAGALAEALVFYLYSSAHGARTGAATVARAGGVLFFEFHHVGFVFEIPRTALPSSTGLPFFSARFTVGLAADRKSVV